MLTLIVKIVMICAHLLFQTEIFMTLYATTSLRLVYNSVYVTFDEKSPLD